MRACLAALALVASAAPAWSQLAATERGPWDNYSGPYKLVITWYQAGIVVTDYPSRARCERGREAVVKRFADRASRTGFPAESGDVAFCIPG